MTRTARAKTGVTVGTGSHVTSRVSYPWGEAEALGSVSHPPMKPSLGINTFYPISAFCVSS
jgi:hypothetical protein